DAVARVFASPDRLSVHGSGARRYGRALAQHPTSRYPSMRYLVVSGDSHAGPSLKHQLRDYCPQRYLDAFDDFVEGIEQVRYAELAEVSAPVEPAKARSALGREGLTRIRDCRGLQEVGARLRDMDEQGIAAEVVFSGGQNGEVLPFGGLGFGAANPAQIPLELQHV